MVGDVNEPLAPAMRLGALRTSTPPPVRCAQDEKPDIKPVGWQIQRMGTTLGLRCAP